MTSRSLQNKLCITLLLLLATAVGAHSLAAQGTTATIFGSVADETGALVPHASVTVINLDTNLTQAVTSSDAGEYRVNLLPVGRYSVTVAASGFKKFVQSNIALTVDQQVRVDAALTLGGSTEVVTVTDLPSAINLENATVGRTIETSEVEKLPIVDRNIYSLLPLIPGVQSTVIGNTLGYPQTVVQINGGTTSNNNGTVSYYLDGGLNMTATRNTGNIVPNPEALAEFNVQTSNYNATYGRMSSGVVNVLTKSGSNQFHGSLYEFNRNTDFNATPAFQSLKQPYHRNQFGGVLGGPIRKDKTFFFGEYSGLRLAVSNPVSSAVLPTQAQLSGDFSAYLPKTTPLTKCNPTLIGTDATALVRPFIVCNPTTKLPYANNVITDRLDQTALNILKSLPASNSNASSLTPGYLGYIPAPGHQDEYYIKLNHQLTARQRLDGFYFYVTGQYQIQAGGGNLPWAYQLQRFNQQNINLSDTFTINSNMINQTWATYTRTLGHRNNTPTNTLASFGSNFASQGSPSLPQITVTGYFNLSNAIGGDKAGTDFYSARDLLILNKGKHSLSIGGEFSLNKDVISSNLNNYGVFTFAGSTSARTGNALSDFLLGLQSAQTQDAPIVALDNSFFYSLFAQDDWRIRPNLTINTGIRWDVQTSPTDPQDKESIFIAGRQSTVNPALPLGELVVGDQGVPRGSVTTRFQHISPRIGLAWDPYGNGKTSVRASAGIFWGGVSGNEWSATSNFYPFSLRYTFPVVGTLTNPYANSPSPFPYIYTKGAVKPIVTGGSIEGVAPNFQWPYTYQLTASIQQQVNKSLVLGVAYVGSLARDISFSNDINNPVFNAANPAANTTGNILARRPYDTGVVGQILQVQSNQTANYNAMQVTFQQRLTRGISFNGFYTWSKTIDSNVLDAATAPEDYSNQKIEKGPSNFDQRNGSVTSIVWTPNYGYSNRLVRSIANGWSVSGIVKLFSGLPFNVTTGQDNNLDGQTTDRPNQIGAFYNPAVNRGSRSQLVKQFFNPAAFCRYSVTAPTACLGTGAAGQNGTAQRNGYYGPAQRDIDMGLFRTFNIFERLQLEGRAEVLNAFNLVTLANPNSNLASATVGTITSQATGFNMRQIQLGLRLKF